MAGPLLLKMVESALTWWKPEKWVTYPPRNFFSHLKMVVSLQSESPCKSRGLFFQDATFVSGSVFFFFFLGVREVGIFFAPKLGGWKFSEAGAHGRSRCDRRSSPTKLAGRWLTWPTQVPQTVKKYPQTAHVRCISGKILYGLIWIDIWYWCYSWIFLRWINIYICIHIHMTLAYIYTLYILHLYNRMDLCEWEEESWYTYRVDLVICEALICEWLGRTKGSKFALRCIRRPEN